MTTRPLTSFFSADEPKSKKVKLAASEDSEIVSESPPAITVSASWATTLTNISDWGSAFNALEPIWKSHLSNEINKPYVSNLISFLDAESKAHTVYPPKCHLWTALNLCPYDSVKVVIVGQDPYHGPSQAHGLAFSVPKGVRIPPSLGNMITEANRDPAVRIPFSAHGNLEGWALQGVLLLNTCLTVRKNEANSHQKRGWEDFTDAIVRELGKREGIVYLLWGIPAQAKCKAIDGRKNRIIKTSHPSPLSAYKTADAFMGSCCFSKCNEALKELGQAPIDWEIKN